MAEKKQPFRFRLPWISSAGPRVSRPPPPKTPRSVVQSRAPTQPTKPVPAQNSQVQTQGIALAQPSAPLPAATESQAKVQPEPPSSATTQTQIASSSPSPSRKTTQIQTASLPSSPSHAATESHAKVQLESPTPATTTASLPPSPSRKTTQIQTASLPSSPSHAATESHAKVQLESPSPATTTDSLPPSPPRKTQIQTASPPPSPSPTANESQAKIQQESPSLATSKTQIASLSPSPSRPTNQIQTASLPPSPSHAAVESLVTSQPASPARGKPKIRAASVPSSPSRTTSQVQTKSRTAPQSPIHFDTKIAGGQNSSQSSSPSRTATEVQQPARATIQRPSPSKKLQPTVRDGSQPLSSESQQERKPAASQPSPRELRSKRDFKPDTVSSSQNQTPSETHSKPDEVAKQTTEEFPPRAQKLDPNAISVDHPDPPLESEETLRKKSEQETQQQQEAYDKPLHGKITELLAATSGAGTKIKALQNVAFEADEKVQEEAKNIKKRETIAISSADKKQIHTLSSTPPKDRHTVSESPSKSVQSNGERIPLHKEINKNISKFVTKLATGETKQPFDEKSVAVITIVGENKGASMQLGSESGKYQSIHIHRGYKINQDGSTEVTTDGEGSSKASMPKDSNTKQDRSRAYINNNAQSINNSIVFTSSITERDPGVQLVLSHSPADQIKSNNEPAPFETHKAEFSVTTAEKLTYEPTIRRRCLRGLLLESSDSDPDNPQKPRRHGCRHICKGT